MVTSYNHIDDLIETLSPVQKKRIASSPEGFSISGGTMRTYRALRRKGLIEKPVRFISAVLTEEGQQVFERLSEVEAV